MFRTSLGHLQALKETDPRIHRFFIKTHCGIPNAHNICYKGRAEFVEYMCLWVFV